MCRSLLRLSYTASTLSILLLGGCESTPKHSNTLIFGTTTKFALDISQQPTGAVGFTLGYKRQEAVWMPLLANKGENLEPVQSCTQKGCVIFKGSTGDGGPAGAKAEDTYSVLATLSGQTSGHAETTSVKGGGAIAQVFATGFAARLLAVTGGAALVNTGADPTTNMAVAALAQEAESAITKKKQRIAEIITCLKDESSSNIDQAKLSQLVEKVAAQDPSSLPLTEQNRLKSYGGKPITDLEEYLGDIGRREVPPLHAQLAIVCS